MSYDGTYFGIGGPVGLPLKTIPAPPGPRLHVKNAKMVLIHKDRPKKQCEPGQS